MVAVVQCASSVGGSPRLPTLRTPPFFCAKVSDAAPATRAVVTSTNETTRTIDLSDMVHLSFVVRRIYHTTAVGLGGSIEGPQLGFRLLQPESHVPLAVHRLGGREVLSRLVRLT